MGPEKGVKYTSGAAPNPPAFKYSKDDLAIFAYRVLGLLLVCGQTVWRNYVGYFAVPCGFARPWGEVRLPGAVPLGSAKHAGVNAACRW